VPRYSNALTENFDYLFPIGLSYISAALKVAKHDVDALNLNHYNGRIADLVSNRLNQKTYDFVGTGGNALAFSTIEEIISSAKSHSTKPKILLGGPIITTMPASIFKKFGIDFGVIGDGEETIVELLDAIEKKGDLRCVQGIIFREGKEIVTNENRLPKENLDTIPFPDYEGLEIQKQLDKSHSNILIWTSVLDKPRVYPILASRSCPFHCTFCYHWGNYRKRSLENVMAEISMAVDKYDINFLQLYDDCFSYDRKRLKDFCLELKNLMKVKNKNIKWFCNLIVNTVDRDMLCIMKDAGCVAVSYGFESFSPTVLKSMKKAITPKQIDFAFQETVKQKLHVAATFIFGDVAETSETSQETLNWWMVNARGQVRLTFVMPYPGSEIYERCVRKGFVKDEISFAKNWSGSYNYLNITDKMSDKEIAKLQMKIWRLTAKYSRYVVPSKCEISGSHCYSLTLKCPFCHEVVKYKNLYHYGANQMYTFELICRSCHQKFFAVSPIERLLMITSYFVPRWGSYFERARSDLGKAMQVLKVHARAN
jgi:anaerobic magnesium-protoporphyrin IX monomethyl ester cyclase